MSGRSAYGPPVAAVLFGILGALRLKITARGGVRQALSDRAVGAVEAQQSMAADAFFFFFFFSWATRQQTGSHSISTNQRRSCATDGLELLSGQQRPTEAR